MCDNFDYDGHLTDIALNKLIKQEQGEDARLEISEHMSFCDHCIKKYADMLSDDCLASPSKPLANDIMHKIRHRTNVIVFKKYSAMVIAASIAIVFMLTGTLDLKIPVTNTATLEKITSVNSAFNEKTLEVANAFSQKINNLIG